jgi:hypothetical protein
MELAFHHFHSTAIYQLVSEHINDTWRQRYKSYVASMKEGRKCEVEKIWKRILDDVHLTSLYGKQNSMRSGTLRRQYQMFVE